MENRNSIINEDTLEAVSGGSGSGSFSGDSQALLSIVQSMQQAAAGRPEEGILAEIAALTNELKEAQAWEMTGNQKQILQQILLLTDNLPGSDRKVRLIQAANALMHAL